MPESHKGLVELHLRQNTLHILETDLWMTNACKFPAEGYFVGDNKHYMIKFGFKNFGDSFSQVDISEDNIDHEKKIFDLLTLNKKSENEYTIVGNLNIGEEEYGLHANFYGAIPECYFFFE